MALMVPTASRGVKMKNPGDKTWVEETSVSRMAHIRKDCDTHVAFDEALCVDLDEC